MKHRTVLQGHLITLGILTRKEAVSEDSKVRSCTRKRKTGPEPRPSHASVWHLPLETRHFCPWLATWHRMASP